MKKYVLLLTSACCLASFSHASYIWVGGGNSSTDWGDRNNWELTEGSTWTDGQNGPGTVGSNMWDEIVFDGNKSSSMPVTPAVLEGWVPKIVVRNGAQVTLNNFNKLQSVGETQYISVDETSKITWNNTNIITVRDENLNMTVKSFQGIEFTNQSLNGTQTLNINLDKLGSMKCVAGAGVDASLTLHFSGVLGVALDSMEAKANAGQFTLGATNEDFDVVVRLLWENGGGTLAGSHDFTSLDGDSLVKSDAALTASKDDLGKYYIYQDDVTKGVYVQYVVDKSIPEPSSAMLGLIGFASLMMARRRKN